MNKKTIIAVAVAALALGQVAKAQTNIQVFYDFGSDRKQVTTTIEGFYNDNWGNTFFFVDHDFNHKANEGTQAITGTYMEIARCLNFWHSVPGLNAFSLQVEYNGGLYYGFGANTDIVTASVEAYIDCINKFKN